MMSTIKIMRLLSTVVDIVWIFPFLRQRHSRFRNYFFLICVAAVVSDLMELFHFRLNFVDYFYLLISGLTLIAVWKGGTFKKKYIQYILVLFVTAIAFAFRKGELAFVIFLILHVCIILIFLSNFVMESLSSKSINLFLIFIMLYELSLVSKIFMSLIYSVPSLYYYFFTTIFEIMLGILFCFIVESNPWLHIKLKA